MTAEHLIDPEALAGLRALDPAGGDAVVREIAAIFLEDTPGRLAELEAAEELPAVDEDPPSEDEEG